MKKATKSLGVPKCTAKLDCEVAKYEPLENVHKHQGELSFVMDPLDGLI